MKKLKLSQGWVVFLLILILVIIDQAIKIIVKTHMVLGEE
ncbi:MAG: lipoprotein signal peptidase, partial [Porphyromonadaceae bacterium]|nr:lipoprotein signal peptidase [Porphyromonadaceae bacterium]